MRTDKHRELISIYSLRFSHNHGYHSHITSPHVFPGCWGDVISAMCFKGALPERAIQMRPEVPEHFRRAATHLKSCQTVQMPPPFWNRFGIPTLHVFFANSDMTPEQVRRSNVLVYSLEGSFSKSSIVWSHAVFLVFSPSYQLNSTQ